MTRFTCGIGMFIAAFAVAAQTFVVPPELWDRPRSGRTVLEQPAIRQAVNACLTQPGSRLIVRRATGQESLLAAEELRAWLGALAVEPGRISLRNDLKPSEPLRLEVAKAGAQ
ncbi:MAG: hypothetical protein ACRET7_03750 [Burkholderiales bacterium]